jgi:hypothetical protein
MKGRWKGGKNKINKEKMQNKFKKKNEDWMKETKMEGREENKIKNEENLN